MLLRRFAVLIALAACVPFLGVQLFADPSTPQERGGTAFLVSHTSSNVPVWDTQDSKKDEKKKEAQPSIAVFRLSGSVTETPRGGDPFAAITGGGPSISLKDLVARLRQAATDEHVKAVVLLVEGGSLGSAQKEEVRQAMAYCQSKGKEVVAHTDSLSMSEYVLLSGASRLSAVPTADLWVTGLHGEAPYLRGLLNLLSVTPDYLTCGAYKSAAEIFLREGPSHEAEAMQNWLLDSMYETSVKLIAQGRKVAPTKVKEWIDSGPHNADQAKSLGMIDAVEHRQDFEAMLKNKFGSEIIFDKKYGEKKGPQMDLSSPLALFKILGNIAAESKKKPTKQAVGIVYVEGPIVIGKGGGLDPFGGARVASAVEIRKALDEAANDDTVKAVVLRVDSPGGSAVASEIILDATRRVKLKKPFVVSMGDVAGSGGYYVACAADTIYADESTITASIGVVSGKFVTDSAWKRIGISFKEYNRGKNASLLGSSHPFTPEEKAKMQSWMDEVYTTFKGHVTAIRGNRLKKDIDELAGGRVFTGVQALELGLVDKIGTLQDAVEFVADKANLKEYDIRAVPAPKNLLEKILEEGLGGGESNDKDKHHLDARTGSPLVPMTKSATLVDLAMPYFQHLDPSRVSAIKAALGRMQLLQQEGVILMMPEFRFGN